MKTNLCSFLTLCSALPEKSAIFAEALSDAQHFHPQVAADATVAALKAQLVQRERFVESTWLESGPQLGEALTLGVNKTVFPASKTNCSS